MNTKTKLPCITNAQIRQLSSEAAEAGDLDMVAACERAMDGDDEACNRVAYVIAMCATQATL